MSGGGVYVPRECDGRGSCGRDCPGRPHSYSAFESVGPEPVVPASAPPVPFEIETADGRKFVVHAADEAQARARFEASVASGTVVWHAKADETYKPLGGLGAIVAVRPEPPVKTTLQEGPTYKRGA